MNELSYNRVAVAIDGSPSANAAIAIALKLVDRGGEVAFVHAVDRRSQIANFVPSSGSASSASEFIDTFERQLFGRARMQAAALGIRSTQSSIYGTPGSGISAFAERAGADVLVMGTHSDAGIARAALESTAEVVMRKTRIPTIVTSDREHSTLESGIRNVLVAVDGSAPSAHAIACGIGLALRYDAAIEFVDVTEREEMRRTSAARAAEAACARAGLEGLRASHATLHGRVPEALCEAVVLHAADVLVIGTHGRIGEARRRKPSIAEAVVRAASCPVMVVPERRLAESA